MLGLFFSTVVVGTCGGQGILEKAYPGISVYSVAEY